MTNEDIRETIERFKKDGTQIRVRDIAFCLLAEMFETDATAYQCLFGNEGYEDYVSSPTRKKVREYLHLQRWLPNERTESELSFEENRKEMQGLIDRFEEGMASGLIEPATGLAKIADIRVKLNDKFNIQEEQQERVIQVLRKFNAVCECGREIYKPTKQELMEEYDLIEKTR